ncbi:hypothetical protein ABPG75_000002 [Micractinium tetrahymenae]
MQAPDLTVDGHAPEAEATAAIVSACQRLLPGWAGAPVDVRLLAGGISNALFAVSCPVGKAAFRIYGDNTERFVDRARELDVMRLVHQHGFGPQVLATFANGRIEEFLPMRSLQPEELAASQFVPTIAATLARFHSIPPRQGGEKRGRTPFGRIYEWLDIAEQFVFDDPEKQRVFATFDFAALRAEVKHVEQAAAAASSPIVFSHNDLLSGNIMVPLDAAFKAGAVGEAFVSSSSSSRGGSSSLSPEAHEAAVRQRATMTFIDFEYADWAPRGFDWGNHFCEYAGFECDYTRYPGKEQAVLFIQHYLAAAAGSQDCDAAALDKAELARCVAEANVFALAAHQYWGTWSLLQANWSSIDFDYLGYAQLRWGEYHRRKEEFLAEAARAFGPDHPQLQRVTG